MILTCIISGEPRIDFMLRTGWKVVGYRSYFSDTDGSNKDRYVVMQDPNSLTNRDFLESVLMSPFDV